MGKLYLVDWSEKLEISNGLAISPDFGLLHYLQQVGLWHSVSISWHCW